MGAHDALIYSGRGLWRYWKLGVFLLAAQNVLGQAEPNWKAICAQAIATTPLPPDAAATAADAPANGTCDEQTLYYGFGKAPDYGAALRCAYSSWAHPSTKTGGFLDGAGTLSMLYANGDGVARSYPLSIRFACEVANRGGQNNDERIGRLEALRDGKVPPGNRFDLCDGQMSGVMGTYCSDLQGKKNDVARVHRLEAIEQQLPAEARQMLPDLQAAETAFEQARLRGEYNGCCGSGSMGFALDDQDRLREQFVINLERFEAGKLPKASAVDQQQAEQELNAAYGAVTAMPAPDPRQPHVGGPPPPTAEGFAATEAAWQTLFEQWLRFVPVAFPALSQTAAATELLRLRSHQLRHLAG